MRPPALDRRGTPAEVVAEDHVRGFAPGTLFVRCSARSRMWHVSLRQSAILVAGKALCGATPYAIASDTRSDWHGERWVSVCSTCLARAAES